MKIVGIASVAEEVVEVGSQTQQNDVCDDEPEGSVDIGFRCRFILLCSFGRRYIKKVVSPEHECFANFVAEVCSGDVERILVVPKCWDMYSGQKQQQIQLVKLGAWQQFQGVSTSVCLNDGLQTCFSSLVLFRKRSFGKHKLLRTTFVQCPDSLSLLRRRRARKLFDCSAGRRQMLSYFFYFTTFSINKNDKFK